MARLFKVSSLHAQRFHDQKVRDLTPQALVFDELWGLLKKQKNCAEDECHEAGDFWDHTAVTADSKLMVSLGVGKRTKKPDARAGDSRQTLSESGVSASSSQ